MTPPTERCPTCDREGCQRAATVAAYQNAPGGADLLPLAKALIDAERECLDAEIDGKRARRAREVAERRKAFDEMRTAAAQWAKVAPLIERLREERTFAGRLRPCPFCGDEAEFEREGTRRQSCIVRCTNCSGSHEGGDEGARSGASWNRRAGDELIAAILAATEATP